ncbi:hypothetical protein ACROAG_20385 [Shewanella oncorhynchi]|uniref:hypothetical protein n=1 Tax=Shewanella oncorhynchi TaxID=2726434 RepID=UPI003D7B36A4
MKDFFVLGSLSDLGSWASIVGFIITFITFGLLIRLKKKFFFRSNVETHQKALVSMASEMSAYLADYDDNKDDILELLALVEVELRAIQKGASDDLLKDVKQARALIKAYSRRGWLIKISEVKSESKAREIKTSLTVVAAQFEHVKKGLLAGSN